MKLQQLKYIHEVAQNNLNVSLTAQKLFTSQPGVSKQIRLLEDELGVEVFVRSGKHITAITPAGEQILLVVQDILSRVNNIKEIAKEHNEDASGKLSIATTHTQAKYVLPSIIEQFKQNYPNVLINIHQGTPTQVGEMLASGVVDFALATELTDHPECVSLPCYHWHRSLIVPKGHPLTLENHITLASLSQHPIVTYTFALSKDVGLEEVFAEKGLTPNIVLTASDSDVIKTYVQLGMGVGIVAKLALGDLDESLVALDAGHLFKSSLSKIFFKKHLYLRKFMLSFIESLGTHLNSQIIMQATKTRSQGELDALFLNSKIPTYQ